MSDQVEAPDEVSAGDNHGDNIGNINACQCIETFGVCRCVYHLYSAAASTTAIGNNTNDFCDNTNNTETNDE